MDELLDERGLVERDAPTEQDVEVLEWNRADVRRDDAIERGERGVARPGVPDASEVGGEVGGYQGRRSPLACQNPPDVSIVSASIRASSDVAASSGST